MGALNNLIGFINVREVDNKLDSTISKHWRASKVTRANT